MIDWEDLALQTAERFGGTLPHPDTSAAIATVYARAPQAVTRAIDRVADDYDQGNVRSPWGVLKSRIQQITVDQHAAARATGRDKAIERAEQWIRTAGLHYDRWTEVHDDLFGERGRLRDHATPELEHRMENLWNELRPLGVKAEDEAEARGRAYAAQKPNAA